MVIIRHIIVQGIASEVPLGIVGGMPKECVANLDKITTVARSCLCENLTRLAAGKMKQVEEAVRFSLGMER